MGKIETYRPPASVAFEGKALSVVTRLSKVAQLLAENVSEDADRPELEAQARLREAAEMLDRVVGMMTAVETTLDRFEARADNILEVMTNGEEISFCSKANDEYYVSGVIARRLRTLNINVIGINNKVPRSYANLNVTQNIILLRDFKHRRHRIAFRVAC